MDNKEPPDWNFYDKFKVFEIDEAALLWFEIVPSPLTMLEIFNSHHVEMIKRQMVREVNKRSFKSNKQKILRTELLDLANDLDMQPKLLFPEARTSEPSVPKEEVIDPRRRQTYLKLIKALLNQLKIDPKQRGVSPKIKGFVERAGLKLDEQTIRDVLKELEDVDEE